MKPSTYKCLNCEQECKRSYQSNNKYCSIKCSAEHRSNEHKQKFFSGLLEHIDRPTARKYLAEVRGYNCEICGLSEWNNNPITLHVDHTNGDPANSKPNNLRLLCPNCHSQTEFLGGANKGRGRGSQGLRPY